jgi:pimeloyl-ACP methyl ester carboxylesterase
VPYLTADHRLVGVDTPGHGGSSEPERWDWDVAVAFVEHAVEALALGNPFVVGHSLGGMVAARYGLAHPDAPGVVNVDGHGRGGPSVPPEFHAERQRLMEAMEREAPADAGDDDWLRSQLEAMRPLVEAFGRPWDEAEPAIRRSYARAADGAWHRKPSNAFIQSLPKEMGPELFDIYREETATHLLTFMSS